MTIEELNGFVDGLIKGPQYERTQAAKDEIFVPALRCLSDAMRSGCPEYARFVAALGPSTIDTPADVTPIPVAMFKLFELRSVPAAQIVRELSSSGTTTQQRSRIFVDKTTAFRQTRALAAILKEHIGSARRPFLVIDAPEAAGGGDTLVARGAAIRGLESFGSSTTYALRSTPAGALELDREAVDAFFQEVGGGAALLFGFSYIVWERFVEPLRSAGAGFHATGAQLLHSGGWKKLHDKAVPKEVFSRTAAQLLGCPVGNVIDFYGMVEQVGTVFIDCEAGHKHAPAFADVIIRRGSDLSPVSPGETGVIEVLSLLPTSYPGHAIITEDQGTLLGVDDCACRRKGRYFRFAKRIERAELRGCGDVFAQSDRDRGTT
jgi:hypothetical protein